eukprot:scaffold2928_cov159-Skeletonema_dohrnii-CCMP3373.AAC.1
MSEPSSATTVASSAAGVDLAVDDDFFPPPLPLGAPLALVAAFRCGLAAGGFVGGTEAADSVTGALRADRDR